MEYLSPKAQPRALRCRIHQKRMKLFPLDLLVPADYWYCLDCDRKVTLDERDSACLREVEALKQKHNLKEMQYNPQSHKWYIVSNEWEGTSRLDAKRKQLTKSQEDDIVDELRHSLLLSLRIEFDTFEEYFQE